MLYHRQYVFTHFVPHFLICEVIRVRPLLPCLLRFWGLLSKLCFVWDHAEAGIEGPGSFSVHTAAGSCTFQTDAAETHGCVNQLAGYGQAECKCQITQQFT